MIANFITTLEVEELPGGGRWRLLDVLAYDSVILSTSILVPKGFVTDGYSAPHTLFGSWVIRGLDMRPAVIHDRFYTTGEVSREQADSVLLEAMEAVGIPSWKRRVIYASVRLGGGLFYDHEERSSEK